MSFVVKLALFFVSMNLMANLVKCSISSYLPTNKQHSINQTYSMIYNKDMIWDFLRNYHEFEISSDQFEKEESNEEDNDDIIENSNYDIRFHSYFSENMVFQSDAKNNVWGYLEGTLSEDPIAEYLCL